MSIPGAEETRVANLVDAQGKAQKLFDEVEARGVIAAGVTEVEASDAIRDMAAEMFGVSQHWHRRIVRAGPNTLEIFRSEPPDRVMEADDIAFCDFGPVFEDWEADFGRTFVIGDDPDKIRLRDTLPVVFDLGRAYFQSEPGVTGEQLYAHMVQLAADHGWTFGGQIAGHLVGEFPHETIDGERIESYIAPGNDTIMRRTDRAGRLCHWSLEVHLVDRERRIGGFYEQLLDVG
jgi:Xaa-Pro aminopeptidase